MKSTASYGRHDAEKCHERKARPDGPAMAVSKELMSIPDFGSEDETAFAAEKKAVPI
jgi:hypothetical protein